MTTENNDVEKVLDANIQNIVEILEVFLEKQDERFCVYEKNYRPTHKNKLDISSYIKDMLGDSYEGDEVEKVKRRVRTMMGAKKWQDIPYKKLTDKTGMAIVDDSIKAIIGYRVKVQTNLFDSLKGESDGE